MLIIHYDVCIIGAGPAGIFCAYQLIEQNENINIIIVEEGKDYLQTGNTWIILNIDDRVKFNFKSNIKSKYGINKY